MGSSFFSVFLSRLCWKSDMGEGEHGLWIKCTHCIRKTKADKAAPLLVSSFLFLPSTTMPSLNISSALDLSYTRLLALLSRVCRCIRSSSPRHLLHFNNKVHSSFISPWVRVLVKKTIKYMDQQKKKNPYITHKTHTHGLLVVGIEQVNGQDSKVLAKPHSWPVHPSILSIIDPC